MRGPPPGTEPLLVAALHALQVGRLGDATLDYPAELDRRIAFLREC